jgi:hypothetical protein
MKRPSKRVWCQTCGERSLHGARPGWYVLNGVDSEYQFERVGAFCSLVCLIEKMPDIAAGEAARRVAS